MVHLDEMVLQRKRMVELLAAKDERYRLMLCENAVLERKYNAVLSAVTTEQMDILCDFLMHCEAMSDRMLELACTYMVFPE